MRKGIAIFRKEMSDNYQLYLMLLFPTAMVVLFAYGPMYGAQIAFKDYRAVDGIRGSQWVGLKYLSKFIDSPSFAKLLVNTLMLSIYGLIAGFPIPIALALMLNNTKSASYRKTVQMVTYAPHFISTVVIVGMMAQLFSYNYGIVNKVIEKLGGTKQLFLTEPTYFRHMYVWSSIWQNMGYDSIIFISALSSIDPALYEAASVDGANKLHRIIHIELPGILPTIITLLILNTGKLLSVGYEKVLVMQNDLNRDVADVISTYVYRMSFDNSLPNYPYSTAIGLFNSIINFVIIISVNAISKRVSETSLW